MLLVRCSKHSIGSLIQPVGDSASQGGGLSIVIANRLDGSFLKARVKILQHRVVANSALSSRGRTFYANLQAGTQNDKIERHVLQDLARRVDVSRRY